MGIVEEAGLLPIVVAGDTEVAAWSLTGGIPTVADPGMGLSAAATAGVSWAKNVTNSWVVLHTDLPLLTSGELGGVVEAVELGRDVIAPSSDGGTTLIGSVKTIDFSYGPGSFSVHVSKLREPEIVTELGLLHDLDSPDDLRSILSHPRGRWLAEIIGSVESRPQRNVK